MLKRSLRNTERERLSGPAYWARKTCCFSLFVCASSRLMYGETSVLRGAGMVPHPISHSTQGSVDFFFFFLIWFFFSKVARFLGLVLWVRGGAMAGWHLAASAVVAGDVCACTAPTYPSVQGTTVFTQSCMTFAITWGGGSQ